MAFQIHHLHYRIHKMLRLKLIHNSEKGFSLLEMIIVLSVLTILATIGIASFSSGSKTASMETASSDVVSVFQLARSRAISQVKPDDVMVCNGELLGYEVDIDTNTNEYALKVACGSRENSNVIVNKVLPNNVTFNSSSQTSFFFPILTGNVEGSGVVTINGYGMTRSITIDTVGGITLNNE